MEEKYLICEDSLEGVFTGIYEAYALREEHERLHIQTGEEENYRLFARYVNIDTDLEKAGKVIRTIRARLGEEAYLCICRALASKAPDKGEAVYKTLVGALSGGMGRRVMENLTDAYVRRVFELSRRTANEINRFIEFTRFKESGEGILFAKIDAECNVIPFIMPHFSDRLPLENFIIYDVEQNIYGVHPAGKEWYIISDFGKNIEDLLEASEKEGEYQELFTLFCHTLAIKERNNEKLQRQLLPLRFRENMPEFAKEQGGRAF